MKDDIAIEPKQQVWRAFFIDSENGIEELMKGFEKLTNDDTIIVFHRGKISNNVRTQLELGPAKTEWIKCIDRGVKNSMDVQIIAEFTLRLAAGAFKEGYIISCDKGYNPAIHYLQLNDVGCASVTGLSKSINEAIYVSTQKILSTLDRFDNREDLQHAFGLLLGETRADRFIEKLISALIQNEMNAEKPGDSCTDLEVDGSDGADNMTAIMAPADSSSSDASFVATSLTDMKGIGAALSKKMKNAGIDSPEKLKQFGSVETWRRIKTLESSFPLKWIYVFEAAILNCPLSSIDSTRRIQLKHEAKAS